MVGRLPSALGCHTGACVGSPRGNAVKHLIRHTVEHFIIVEGENASRCLEIAKQAAADDWKSGTHTFTAQPTCGKFTLSEALNHDGDFVPAWGFDFQNDPEDIFITDATKGETGILDVDPAYYNLTQEEVDELTRLNEGRNV